MHRAAGEPRNCKQQYRCRETSAPAMTEADAIAKEKAVWDTVKNKNYDGFASMLASDEMEVTGGDGVLEKRARFPWLKILSQRNCVQRLEVHVNR